MTELRSVVHKENINGQKYRTFRDTNNRLQLDDNVDQIFIDCTGSVRYEVNHFRAEPQTPNHNCRQLRSVEWSIVLQAAKRSNKTKAVGSPLVRDMWTSLFFKMRALSVE